MMRDGDGHAHSPNLGVVDVKSPKRLRQYAQMPVQGKSICVKELNLYIRAFKVMRLLESNWNHSGPPLEGGSMRGKPSRTSSLPRLGTRAQNVQGHVSV